MANNFSNNTVLVTQCAAGAKQSPVSFMDTGLDEVPSLALILDSLERLSIGPTIASVDMCQAAISYKDAVCSVISKTTPGDLDPQKLYALIFYKLNQALT